MSGFLRTALTVAAVVLGIVGVAVILHAWQLPPFTTSRQTTDNAYVRGRVTTLAPQVAGYVRQVPVDDFQEVKKGQLLVEIDDSTYRRKLDQANASLASQKAALATSEQQRLSAEAKIHASEANVNAAKAVLDNASTNAKRIETLSDRNIASRVELDNSRSTLEQARASFVQAEANLDVARQDLKTVMVSRQTLEAAVQNAEASVGLAQIDLNHTRVIAPEDGKLGEIGVRVGSYVTSGTQLMSLVPPERWVIANFKETQIGGMKVGVPATLVLDVAKDMTFTGRIVSLSPATGSEFSVLRPDNATGNFTKVAQRVAIRIELDGGQSGTERFLPGLSVVVTADPG